MRQFIILIVLLSGFFYRCTSGDEPDCLKYRVIGPSSSGSGWILATSGSGGVVKYYPNETVWEWACDVRDDVSLYVVEAHVDPAWALADCDPETAGVQQRSLQYQLEIYYNYELVAQNTCTGVGLDCCRCEYMR